MRQGAGALVRDQGRKRLVAELEEERDEVDKRGRSLHVLGHRPLVLVPQRQAMVGNVCAVGEYDRRLEQKAV
jgi:hypothetical protein